MQPLEWMRKIINGPLHGLLLQRIAECTNKPLHHIALRELELYDEVAWNSIMNRLKLKHWVKAFFSNYVRSNIFCNNLFESFNIFILEARHKPIISMMESIEFL